MYIRWAASGGHFGRNRDVTLTISDQQFAPFAPEQSEVSMIHRLVRQIASFDPIRNVFDDWGGMMHDKKRTRSSGERHPLLFGCP
jgi:hypothetical protein